ncbi:MAG: DUF4255 domain-containing protein [Actinomycetota bacterium]
MIHEVDEALRNLIRREALNGSDVEVTFDAPTKDWAARRNSPTVSVYLYDIREDLERREVEFEEIRDETGRVVERRPPPRRFKLSYLLTAWTQRPEDEHRLLAAVLSCFLRRDALPKDVLVGSLADQPLAIVSHVGLPPPKDRNLSDVWSALGGELKPSLDLVITAPFDARRMAEVGPPVLAEPVIKVTGPDGMRDAAGGRMRRTLPRNGDTAKGDTAKEDAKADEKQAKRRKTTRSRDSR